MTPGCIVAMGRASRVPRRHCTLDFERKELQGNHTVPFTLGKNTTDTLITIPTFATERMSRVPQTLSLSIPHRCLELFQGFDEFFEDIKLLPLEDCQWYHGHFVALYRFLWKCVESTTDTL